jgi:hypothetical protein
MVPLEIAVRYKVPIIIFSLGTSFLTVIPRGTIHYRELLEKEENKIWFP